MLAAAFTCSVFVHLGLLSGAGLAMRMTTITPHPSGKAPLQVDFSAIPGQPTTPDQFVLAQILPSRKTRPESATQADAPGVFDVDAITGTHRAETDSIRQVGHGLRHSHFYPSAALDRPPLPISAPNPRKFLSGTDIPSLLFRLRLYVDSAGTVVSVETRQPIAMEETSIQPVKDMFLATMFVPGRLKGRDVPSYLDVEVQLDDLARL